uniref:PR domain zinc finger protein 10 n=1 Tax=Gadus morhua TaxID=8049 RepID=A0A8C5BFQ3_GADMO
KIQCMGSPYVCKGSTECRRYNVHFEGGAVAQIVYSGEQQGRGQEQVVYTADGGSYTSVESAEHTLVYIHPADGSQFADQPQVAYIQQDGTTQQVTVLLPSGQNMNAANLHVLSNVAEDPQALLEPVSQVTADPMEQMSNSLSSMTGMAEPPPSPLGATDSTEDSDEEEDEDEDSDLDDWEPRLPLPFTPHSLWCEECNCAHPSACLKHGALHPLPNRPVVSKARASLPLLLYMDRFMGGVFSKRRIPKRTQFGPLEGPLVPESQLQDHNIHLKLCMLDSDKDGEKTDESWVDLSDEDSCNWMMFVRPAQNHLEQNLVAYQYGSEIFYTTIKNIQPKQELKVWYAASYAQFVNQKIHTVTEEERKVLREQEKNWPCYECNRRFVSSEQLQQHLNMHDEKLTSVTRGRGRGRGRKRFGTGRRPGRPPKFVRLELDPLVETSVRERERHPVEHTVHVPPSESTSSLISNTFPKFLPFFLSFTLVSPAPLHPTQNAALQHLFIRKSFRPFKCTHCGKAFRDKDKLEQHLRVHGRDAYAFACHLCNKSFPTDAAFEDHLALHMDNRSYACLLCPDSFEKLDLLKEHVGVHAGPDGCFTCPSCKKCFSDFIQVKKHIRCFHSEKIFQCPDCDKAFCRPDKLRLHMLRHSDRKDFLCSSCGKQFKRKDKLREHMQRMHNPDREAKKADRVHRSKALKLKVPTADLDSFMFKCRVCMMGFRRRGMLVNHLSKRHPEMSIDDVPELTLPIIKPNRDYFCQYCDKVYKSASKRKAHILKNHPGSELPPSIRKLRPAGPGEPDPMLSTHTQLTGTIASAPVCCPHCAKQYSSKTKMVQHIRKKHPEFGQMTLQTPMPAAAVISTPPAVINADGTTTESVATTDLLTQAMTELSQTLTTDYRTAQGDYQRIQYIPVGQAGGALAQSQHIQLQVVQVAPASSPHSQNATVDVSQLHEQHGYSQHSIQVQQIQVSEPTGTAQNTSQVAGQPLSPASSQQTGQEMSPSQLTPITLTQSAVQHAYIPSNWNYRGYREYPPSLLGSTHYVISDGQSDLETKQVSGSQTPPPEQADQPTEQQQQQQQQANQQPTTQYIITTTTNGSGTSEVHITKP